MFKPFSIPAKDKSIEENIKRSRFLGTLHKIENIDEAHAKLNTIRNKHPNANHHCYAFIAGNPDDPNVYGFSDDGEPSGTAGKPMLQILQYSGLGKILICIVRYFGGIKLGTGGLVSAYSGVTKSLIEDLDTVLLEPKHSYSIEFPYSMEPILRHQLQQLEVNPTVKYTENVKFYMELSESEYSLLMNQLSPLNLKLASEHIT